MIAIYARQSVDRADSISIESQIQFCQYETRGEAFKTYIDRGYSGKNTDRPAFAGMMNDIENGTVTKVVVYKLDRISRSILDFSSMMERFEKQKVEFVSTTEKFDTSSPMGRAMLNICIVFAQLERETIQKRVADAYFSRSQKSLYMGGRVPYGFRLEPITIDGVKTAMYKANFEEAEQIKLIYELYSHPECSYGDIARYFKEHEILKNGQPWGRTRLADVLKNPIYVRADLSVYEFYRNQGAIMANDPSDFIGVNGCYYYKSRDSTGRKQINLEGNHLVLAPHEGIVSSELWLKCSGKCLEAQQIKPYQKAKNTWLAGKIKCGVCGYALVDKHYPSRKTRYFLCSNKMSTRACPGPGTIYSDEVEQIVCEQIIKKLAKFTTLRKRIIKPANSQLAALNVELAQIESGITSLMDRLPDSDDTLFRYIAQRIHELDGKKQELSKRISELKLCKQADYTEINNHLTMWEELSFEDKRQTVDQLIRVIYATSDSIKIEWRI
ncbi:MAG: recombinase family protein [Clostridiaceae bacterium]|nr:recombinase family protein [Clostridiaceae bacterium]